MIQEDDELDESMSDNSENRKIVKLKSKKKKPAAKKDKKKQQLKEVQSNSQSESPLRKKTNKTPKSSKKSSGKKRPELVLAEEPINQLTEDYVLDSQSDSYQGLFTSSKRQPLTEMQNEDLSESDNPNQRQSHSFKKQKLTNSHRRQIIDQENIFAKEDSDMKVDDELLLEFDGKDDKSIAYRKGKPKRSSIRYSSDEEMEVASEDDVAFNVYGERSGTCRKENSKQATIPFSREEEDMEPVVQLQSQSEEEDDVVNLKNAFIRDEASQEYDESDIEEEEIENFKNNENHGSAKQGGMSNSVKQGEMSSSVKQVRNGGSGKYGSQESIESIDENEMSSSSRHRSFVKPSFNKHSPVKPIFNKRPSMESSSATKAANASSSKHHSSATPVFKLSGATQLKSRKSLGSRRPSNARN